MTDWTDNSDLMIRPARARDAKAVGRVLTRAFSRLPAGDYPPDLLTLALPILSRPKPDLLALPSYFVALEKDRIVAVGGWSPSTPRSRGYADGVGHIRHVACDPEVARRGIAGALMRRALEQAQAAGIGLMCCLSTRTAEPFYRSLGFEGDAEVEVRLQPGLLLPSIEMRKCL